MGDNLDLYSVRGIDHKEYTDHLCRGSNHQRKCTWEHLDILLLIVLKVCHVLRTTARHQCNHLCVLCGDIHSGECIQVLRCILRCYWMPLEIRIQINVN